MWLGKTLPFGGFDQHSPLLQEVHGPAENLVRHALQHRGLHGRRAVVRASD